MAEKDKLVVITPEGKTIKAKIVRRELESAAKQSSETADVSRNKDLDSGHTAEHAGDLVTKAH